MFAFRLLLCVVVTIGSALAMYDAVFPNHNTPSNCIHGCAEWANLAEDGNTRKQSDVDAKFSEGYPPIGIDRSCAMPAKDPETGDSWCYCKGMNDDSWGMCSPPLIYPSEIAVYPVNHTAAVIVFITGEDTFDPSVLPVAEVLPHPAVMQSWSQTPPGGTAKGRTFHFVFLGGLVPKTKYKYRVRSGAPNSPWSEIGQFVSLPDLGSPTKFAIWGDMGVFSWNNMDSVINDFDSGDIDFAAHIGDHGYNIGVESRGDGYFDAGQGVYTHGLWVPGIGNHEFYDDDEFNRYDTYTSGIGRYGSSQTSKYYALTVGLLRLIVLDSTTYFGQPGCDTKAQLQWLENELAHVDREVTPWVMMVAHHPLYCSSITHFDDDKNEQVYGKGWSLDQFADCAGSGIEEVAAMRADWEPLMLKYGVDLYMCGHEHNYESIFPVRNNTKVQDDFENPKAPVHVVSGAGGAPALDVFGVAGPWTRKRVGEAWSYSKVQVVNATTLIWQQWYNSYYGGHLADEFVITQHNHGPFPDVFETASVEAKADNALLP